MNIIWCNLQLGRYTTQTYQMMQFVIQTSEVVIPHNGLCYRLDIFTSEVLSDIPNDAFCHLHLRGGICSGLHLPRGIVSPL